MHMYWGALDLLSPMICEYHMSEAFVLTALLGSQLLVYVWESTRRWYKYLGVLKGCGRPG